MTRYLIAGSLLYAILTATQALSQDTDRLKPYAGESTIMFVKVDVDRLRPPALDNRSKAVPETIKTEITANVEKVLSLARHCSAGQRVFATLDLQGRVFAIRRQVPADDLKQLQNSLPIDTFAVSFANDDVVLYRKDLQTIGTPASDATWLAVKDAFSVVEEFPLQVVVVPPPYLSRAIKELSPELPQPFGGGPSDVLTDGFLWGAIGIDPQRLRFHVTIQSSSVEVAQRLASHLPKMLQSLNDFATPPDSPWPPEIAKVAMEALITTVSENQIHIGLDPSKANAKTLSMLSDFVEMANEEMQMASNSKRLREIMLAVHNYYSAFNALPPAKKHWRDADGKPFLSWRVHLLPFFGEAELYNQFRLDEPWDSEHNKALLEKMPEMYRPASDLGILANQLKPGYTTIAALAGADTALGDSQIRTFGQIIDGTSNTVFLVTVQDSLAVPWTSPQDYAFDPADPLAGVRMNANGKWWCGFGDGSVRQLSGDLSPATVFNLFRINDRNIIELGK